MIRDMDTGMSSEAIKSHLRQRFPVIMVDRVLEMEPGKRIKALKNVTSNELLSSGHFNPGVFIIEAIGQCACILFSQTTSRGQHANEFLVLGTINEMKLFVSVLPGQTMILEVSILKMLAGAALVEGTVTVDGTLIAKGKLSFGQKTP
jgi:3-hydroxymyristoyl/3-hydroxydecanoyl-(acyl carrier protein) dehydratase